METVIDNTSVKKYPAYKDSGVEWLGEIPSYWETKKLKFLAEIQKGRLPRKIVSANESNLPPYMSMEYLRGGEENQWVLDKNPNIIDENETLLLWDGSNAGEFIKSRKGVISSTVAQISFYNIDSNFAWYFSKFLEIELRGKTIGMGIPHVNGDELRNSIISVPPLPEQTAIASFLDRKTALIDQAIDIKKKQIELLKERRQILIHKAVTRGLNPNVKMKDSGVEWIGEVPEGWEVKKIKNLGKIINGFAFNSNEFKGEGVRVMKIANIQTMRIDWSDESFVDEKYFTLYPQFQITRNDLVFALTRPIISTGIKATIVESDEKILLNQRNAVLKPSKDLSKKWIYFIILNTQFVQSFDNQIDKTGQQPNISTYNIGNLEIPFPGLEEQILISEYLEIATTKIATAISLKEQEIEKLKEYKATLINSVVTGKIKVC